MHTVKPQMLPKSIHVPGIYTTEPHEVPALAPFLNFHRLAWQRPNAHHGAAAGAQVLHHTQYFQCLQRVFLAARLATSKRTSLWAHVQAATDMTRSIHMAIPGLVEHFLHLTGDSQRAQSVLAKSPLRRLIKQIGPPLTANAHHLRFQLHLPRAVLCQEH